MGYFDDVVRIDFEIGGFFGGFKTYTINFKKKQACLYERIKDKYTKTKDLSDEKIKKIKNKLEKFDIENWEDSYVEPGACDGEEWGLDILFKSKIKREINGHMRYPDNFDKVENFFKNLIK